MAFSRHTVGDQSPSERLCLYPDSGSLTRARNLGRGSHLDVLSSFRPCGRDLVEFFNSTGWAFFVVRRDKPACCRGCKSPTGKEKATPS
jgi:hypothetical protein